MSERATFDIVIVGQQSWDTAIGSNCRNIALELSRRHRVLYVNSPLERVAFYRQPNNARTKKLRNVIRHKQDGLRRIDHHLWILDPDCLVESINWINNEHIFDFFNKYNNRVFSKSVKAAMRTIGFKDFILFNDNEIMKVFYFQELLKPTYCIYYCRDYMRGVSYWKKHGDKLEPLLIQKADVTLANSDYLANYCRQYNPNSYFIGQGCDAGYFAPGDYPRPHEMPTSKNVIGYVGALDERRLDIDLLLYIAASMPDYVLVLVGEESIAFRISALHRMDNVFFIGIQPMDKVVHYIHWFDICINPQLINQITIGNYPRKIDEYLAMGKPVVATSTEAMNYFRDLVYLASDKEEFVRKITLARSEDSPSLRIRRRNLAESHSWESSVGQIEAKITRHWEANQ